MNNKLKSHIYLAAKSLISNIYIRLISFYFFSVLFILSKIELYQRS